MTKGVKGYKKRPWELTVLGTLFILVPLLSWLWWALPFLTRGEWGGLGIVAAGYFGTYVNGPLGVIHSAWLILLWVLFVTVGIGILRVKKWGLALGWAVALLNAAFSMVLYSVSTGATGTREFFTFNPFQTEVLLNLVFFVPVLFLLQEKILAPFYNPQLKWWEQDPRVRAQLTVSAEFPSGKQTFQTFDISASGMFVGTGDQPRPSAGEAFQAEVKLESSRVSLPIECRVVWVSEGLGRIPAGCGITFHYVLRRDRGILNRYIRQKIREGQQLERS